MWGELVVASDGQGVGGIGGRPTSVLAALHADDGAGGGKVENEGVDASRGLLGGQ